MLRTLRRPRNVALLATTTAGVAVTYSFLSSSSNAAAVTRESKNGAKRYSPPTPWTPPSRKDMLERLKLSNRNKDEEFDLLVIGGGATGAGVALDAASRGLKVALVEQNDFSSGTSSKSTKLVHGGVRYLQKAIFELDYEQYKLVREALHERKIFLHTAPYLSIMQPIMLPVYKWWQLPYYYAGCKMYDILAGHQNISASYLMSHSKAIEAFPMLQERGLVGAVVYYDGMHNDARMNLALIMTAVKHGAAVANYVEVTKLLKTNQSLTTLDGSSTTEGQKDGKLYGAKVKDKLTGEEWEVHAKGIINATGPFTDSLLSLDNPSHKPIVQASAGVHITFPNYYSPRNMGLLDPATSDGRVIFFLPWQGNTIAGTTDSPAPVRRDPRPHEEDIQWILEEVKRYLSPDIQVRRGDVLSAWAGLRPLVSNPNSTSTQALVRNHLIHVSPSGLVTIAGGKWTTYRAMAEETVDEAVKLFGLNAGPCRTKETQLIGSEGWGKNMFISLIQRYGLETEVAQHLSDNYGDRAWAVCGYAEPTGLRWPHYGKRLSRSYPYIEAEVRYAVHNEYALTAVDFLARRSRLTFLNSNIALDVLPRVVEIMGDELHWPKWRRNKEIRDAELFMESMGVPFGSRRYRVGWSEWTRELLKRVWLLSGNRVNGDNVEGLVIKGAVQNATRISRAQFEPGEVDRLKGSFTRRTSTVQDATKWMSMEDVKTLVTEKIDLAWLEESDVDRVILEVTHGRKVIDQEEFIHVCATLKDLAASPPLSRKSPKTRERRRIPVEKSGGGV
ncbi:mitochondrial glycerol-3-phosphate dehydrogenase [Serendipita sp. 411]|nr:mitochondrial glycerol-3-phosphate dehydrogenase [Serendipita sp. 411]